MKPIIEKYEEKKYYKCPQCQKTIVSTMDARMCGQKVNYCPDCGQRLDWEGIVLEVYWPN